MFLVIRKLKGKWARKMKNGPKRGKSVKNGNSPSPYLKYKKKPHRYSTEYYAWRAKVTGVSKKTVKSKSGQHTYRLDEGVKLAA